MQHVNLRDKNAGGTARDVYQFATGVVEIGLQPADLSYLHADLVLVFWSARGKVK